MSVSIRLKNSTVKDKAPVAADLDIGEVAINANAASPAAYIKDSNGNIVKLAGAGAIGGTDATTTAKGIVQLADATAITAGTAGRVVDAAQLKAVSDADDWTRTGTTLAPKTAGDVVNISAGTAAAPGLTPVGDPDSGIFSPGADQVAVATGGTGRVFVDSAGNVGIGVPAPQKSIDTSGDIRLSSGGSRVIDFIQSINAGGYAGPGFYSSSSIGYGVASGGTHRWIGGDGNTELMRLTSTGLGIGTPSPSSALEINAAAATSPFIAKINTAEAARLDASGRLLIGASADSGGALLQVNGDRIRVATAKTPASATDTGTTGEVCWDADYIYVCTATNTWKRTAIATW